MGDALVGLTAPNLCAPMCDSSPPKASILLALEHRPSAELLREHLRRQGHETVHVEDGRDAHQYLETESPGAVVAGTRLPGRTGSELVRLVPPLDPPIVLLGRRGNDGEVVQALEQGAADYITRPFSPPVAAARVRRVLSFREALSHVAA